MELHVTELLGGESEENLGASSPLIGRSQVTRQVFELAMKLTRSTTTMLLDGENGTGLGLAICREIIDAHHEHIWVQNKPTGGACISFLLFVLQPPPPSVLLERA